MWRLEYGLENKVRREFKLFWIAFCILCFLAPWPYIHARINKEQVFVFPQLSMEEKNTTNRIFRHHGIWWVEEKGELLVFERDGKRCKLFREKEDLR